MDIITASETRQLLPVGDAAEVVARGLAGCRHAAHRSDLFRQTGGSPARAFRLKTLVGTSPSCAYLRASTGVVDLVPFAGSVLSRPAFDARTSGLLQVYCLESGELIWMLEDQYLWALALALSASAVVVGRLHGVRHPRVGVLGAGRQAELQILSISRLHPGCRFSIFHPQAARAERFCATLYAAQRVASQPASCRKTCAAGDALVVATSAFSPETPARWPSRRLKAVSVTRATEASAGIVRDADIVVTAAGGKTANVFADASPATRIWAQRRSACKRLVPLAEAVTEIAKQRRVLFACLNGFTGGPVLDLLVEEIHQRLTGCRQRRGHHNSDGRAS